MLGAGSWVLSVGRSWVKRSPGSAARPGIPAAVPRSRALRWSGVRGGGSRKLREGWMDERGGWRRHSSGEVKLGPGLGCRCPGIGSDGSRSGMRMQQRYGWDGVRIAGATVERTGGSWSGLPPQTHRVRAAGVRIGGAGWTCDGRRCLGVTWSPLHVWVQRGAGCRCDVQAGCWSCRAWCWQSISRHGAHGWCACVWAGPLSGFYFDRFCYPVVFRQGLPSPAQFSHIVLSSLILPFAQ